MKRQMTARVLNRKFANSPYENPAHVRTLGRPLSMRIHFFAAAAALFATNAVAADNLPESLRSLYIDKLRAVMEAQANFDDALSFTIVNAYEQPPTERYVLNFDSSRGWSYVDPDPSTITDKQKKFVETIVLTENPEDVTPDFDSQTLQSARNGKITESSSTIAFNFVAPVGAIRNRGEPLNARDALQMEIVISRDDSRLLKWRIFNNRPFKPNNVLKVSRFSVSASFNRPEGFGTDVLARQENEIVGRAFLVKKIEEKWSNTYSAYKLKTH